jgi:D-alanine-D-alanine ligase
MKKIRVGLLCGGRSAEHEVSLQSAKNVIEAIDRDKYEVVLIGIDRAGQWSLGDSAEFLLNADDPKLIALNKMSVGVSLATGTMSNQLINQSTHQPTGTIDVIFPLLHGPYGEDGTIQGLAKLANIPFVGAGVLGSAVAMDKDVMKRLLREAGIPTPDFVVFHRSQKDEIDFEKIRDLLGLPCFIKPANLGSSVGITRAKDQAQFETGVKEAFRHDRKILIETNIEGREIECAVLGNAKPVASALGEVFPTHEFYSYEAKYIDGNGAALTIPADLPNALADQMRTLAVETYQVLACEGMARVDFFLQDDGDVLVNEINTIPGFTKISMYPKLWEASGLSYEDLIDHLIQLALERFEEEQELEN